jgi:cytochrome c
MKLNSKHFFVFVLLLASLAACDSGKDIKRPRDPWVFRSVLDKQPRIVTVTLNENLYVAYDARYCGLYKAWKGDVILDGPVYTTKHGPQPTTKGYAYFEQRLDAPAWQLLVKGEVVVPTAQFQGYYFKDGQVTFKFLLTDAQGHSATVEETPEYITQSGKPGFHRKFVVTSASPETEVQLNTSLTNLQNKTDYETDGVLTVVSERENKYKDGSTTTVDVTLKLKPSGETNLKVYYHPGFDSGDTAEDSPATADALVQGAQLIEGSDCKTCHNEGVKTIGPAYLDVAKKYENNDANVRILVDKVIKGGTGVWGNVAMTPHPDLMAADAEKMVRYIMSLDGEKPQVAEAASDLNLEMNSITFPLTDTNDFEKEEEGKEYPGLAAMLYRTDGISFPIHETPLKSSPVVTGVAPAVHFKEDMFIKEPDLSEFIYMQFQGSINIENDGNYVFRLVSDDGSILAIDGKELVNNDGDHGPQARDGEVVLKKGKHKLQLNFYQGRGGYVVSLQWAKHGDNKFTVIPNTVLSHTKADFKKSVPFVPMAKLTRNIPGDKLPLQEVHPSFDIAQARPASFEPRVGGMDFMSDSSLIVCTWDSVGPVYRLQGVTRNNPEQIKVTRIAAGLAEPLGIKVVNDTIYVLQKQELTRLIDHDGDGIIDEYQTVCDKWRVSPNFHEFAFGLAYKDGYFYAALATAIEPGGASANPQIPDRGKVVKISKKDGSIEFLAHGLRTPNGVGIGVDGEVFVADNQGDWLPSSKIVHVKKDAWYGSRSVDFEGTASLKETLPVVWLPQDEIGNSPSQPAYLNVGPYAGQQIHGEVTHGGLKRVFVEKVNGEYQGVVFRFVQGLEGGVNRIVWGPDGSLYVGMIGNPGNWGQTGKKWFGLQRLTYNNKPAFEMLAIRAKSDGVEIEMTEPIAERFGNTIADYEVKQWYYKPTADYGGPKLGLEDLKIKSVNISADRKKVFLELPGMKANHIVYVRLAGVFISQANRGLWSTEAWYTMNQIPANQPGFRSAPKVVVNNTLTEAEIAAGWKLLFDGKTTNGWRKFKSDKVGSAWKVKDGALYLDNTKKNDWQVEGGGDIITNDEFENFELELEWKIQPCGNSGVMFNVVESDEYDYVWNTGPEMQVLDNPCHPDGRFEKHRAGDLYDMIATKFVTVNPGGQWNQARLISNQGKVEFWLNGYLLVTFDMRSPEWTEMIKNSKFKDMKGFGLSKKGHLSLQDHGDMVWYRNIRIREIR